MSDLRGVHANFGFSRSCWSTPLHWRVLRYCEAGDPSCDTDIGVT